MTDSNNPSFVEPSAIEDCAAAPRRKRPLVGAALALATVPVMLLGGEGLVRLTQRGQAAPQADRHFFCQYDAELGWVNRPNTQCTFKGHPLAINDRGLRDDDPVVPNDDNQKARVLLLGDSQVFGDGVAIEETLGARLETLLPGVQTLNAGAIGYGGDQCVLLLKRLADRLKPNLTILTLNAFDLRDHVTNEIKGGYRKPRFVLNNAGEDAQQELELEPVVAPSVKQRLGRWLTQHSRLYMLAKRQHTRPAGAAQREAARWDSPDAVFPENLDEALAVTASILVRFDADVQRIDGRAAVVWLPYEMDYTSAEFRGRSNVAVGRLADGCRQLGLPLIDLRPALENITGAPSDDAPLTAQPHEYFLDKLHFSPSGHARIASALAERLVQLKLIPAQTSQNPSLTQATPQP